MDEKGKKTLLLPRGSGMVSVNSSRSELCLKDNGLRLNIICIIQLEGSGQNCFQMTQIPWGYLPLAYDTSKSDSCHTTVEIHYDFSQ